MILYSYWPPTQKQYFFPQTIPFVSLVNDFYKPYKLKAKIGWYFFLHSKWLQKKFSVKEDEIPVPISLVQAALLKNNIKFSYFLINLGTIGIQQKNSIIVIDQNLNKIAVIKLSQNEIPKNLIQNESKWLGQLTFKSFNVPKLLFYENTSSINLLAFDYLKGRKLSDTNCSNKIIDIIKSIISFSGLHKIEDLFFSFAHGDFCPWNMLIDKYNKYSLIDWEMAGEYPLGYDLFTFIFQTNFLINSKAPKKLLSTHKDIIVDFFESYNIHAWQPYLKSFCSIKMSKENIKAQKFLFKKFQVLNNLL